MRKWRYLATGIGPPQTYRNIHVPNLDHPQKASRLYRGLTVPVGMKCRVFVMFGNASRRYARSLVYKLTTVRTLLTIGISVARRSSVSPGRSPHYKEPSSSCRATLNRPPARRGSALSQHKHLPMSTGMGNRRKSISQSA